MKLQTAPEGQRKDQGDDDAFRHNRARHEGFRVGAYVQTPPMLFTADGHPLWLGDCFRGRSCFLICGGPSFAKLDHAPLRQPGILTAAVNNAPRTFRPNLWFSVDSPESWIRSIWEDPAIAKFVPLCHANKRIFDSVAWKRMDKLVRDCPNVAYYRRNERFNAKQYLWESSVNWGCHKDHGGGRSIMLAAIRLLFFLGVRRVFLLGCDFKMDAQQGYHFPQGRHEGSVKGNNETYAKLNEWFAELRPLFERERFAVLNCNPESNLKAFGFIPYDEAVKLAREEFGDIDTAHERTAGLYDLRAREEELRTVEAKLKQAEAKADAPRVKKLRKQAKRLRAEIADMRERYGFTKPEAAA